jgi:hypothetical protein
MTDIKLLSGSVYAESGQGGVYGFFGAPARPGDRHHVWGVNSQVVRGCTLSVKGVPNSRQFSVVGEVHWVSTYRT